MEISNYDAIPLFPTNVFIAEVSSELCRQIDVSKFPWIDENACPDNFLEKDRVGDYMEYVTKSYASINHRILEEYTDLRDEIECRFSEIAHSFFRYDNEFFITTSWLTKIAPGGFSERHYHKNSFYSGVLYFDDYDERDEGNIGFFSPVDTMHSFFINPYVVDNEYTAGSHWFKPKHAYMILFPSYLQHRVSVYKGKENRYSLAFNIMPKGRFGIVDSTYDSNWI